MGALGATMMGQDAPPTGALSELFNSEFGINEYKKVLDEYLPTVDDGDFWTQGVPNGIGSALAFFGGGYAMKLTGVSASVASGLIGALSQGNQQFEDAVRGGATPMEAFVNLLSGYGFGSTEGMMGLGTLIENVGKRLGRNIFKEIIGGMAEESFQEGFQQLGQNLTAKETFDMSRDLLDGVGQSMGVLSYRWFVYCWLWLL